MSLGIALLSCLLAVSALSCTATTCQPPAYYAPAPGAPYTAEDLRIPTPKGHVLAGTLTLPCDAAPPLPAVVLITGSSPQDRDHMSNTRKPWCFYKPFRQIADALSRRGIAVLRMDDEGVGCSGGGPLKEVTVQERADDTRSGIEYLRGRKEIDRTRIALLGLSEGGNIGPMIAASDSSIRALVIMAGSASSGYEIIEFQKRIRIFSKSGFSLADKEQKLADSMESLRLELANGKGSRWLYSFVQYNPLPTASKVACPALILHGDKDAQVPAEHAYLLAKAMRFGGNKDVTLKILADHNHIFLPDPDGRVSGYKALLWRTNQLSDDVLNTIAQWLAERLTET